MAYLSVLQLLAFHVVQHRLECNGLLPLLAQLFLLSLKVLLLNLQLQNSFTRTDTQATSYRVGQPA